MLRSFMSYVIARAGESSTYRGLATVLAALGIYNLSPTQEGALAALGLAVAGAINTFRKARS